MYVSIVRDLNQWNNLEVVHMAVIKNTFKTVSGISGFLIFLFLSMTVVYSLVCVRGGTVYRKKSNCMLLHTRFSTH